MLIKAYGEHWSRSRVDWKRRQMPGVLKGKRLVNVWEQKGVYALYDQFVIVYVGQAESRTLGQRLNEHQKDRFAERWDRFSWFGVRSFDPKTERPIDPSLTGLTQENIIRSMELMAILLANAALNRARGKFPSADKVRQRDVETNGGELSLERTISKLRSDLQELEDAFLTKGRKAYRKR
jgi:hypothetical protein